MAEQKNTRTPEKRGHLWANIPVSTGLHSFWRHGEDSFSSLSWCLCGLIPWLGALFLLQTDNKLCLFWISPLTFPSDCSWESLSTSKLGLWRRQWHPTLVLLPGKFHGCRSLEGCSLWGRWGSDTTQQLHFHSSLSCIGEGNGNPLQCCCLENPRDGEAWWAAIYGVAQCRTWLKWLSNSNSKFRLRRWLDWAYVFNQQYCRFSPQLQSPY